MMSKRRTISILEQAIHNRNMDAIEDAKMLANVSETIAALEAEVEMWHDRFLALQPVAFNNATRAEKAEATIERLKCCGNCGNYWHKPAPTTYRCICGGVGVPPTTPNSKCWFLPGVDHWVEKKADDHA